MTRRSDIRKAELRVLDTLRDFLASYGYMSQYDELVKAMNDLDALGLAEPAQARANKCAPVTAQQAAEWMNFEKTTSLHARIIRLLWNGGYQRGLTTEQIEQILHGKHQTVSPRVNELRDAGWITDMGITSPTTSGREAIVWRLSFAAVRALRGQEGLPI